ncbi:Inward rectifier potassium channel, partial [Rubidibacter lacunae KORDI 51-2]
MKANSQRSGRGGKKPSRQVRSPVRIQRLDDGRFQRIDVGQWYSYWRDPYHLMLTVPWAGFIVLLTLLFGLVNGLFALAYMAGEGIANARPGHFGDAFFFSVQTLATIGYGSMYPQTLYANVLVALEALTGLVGLAIVTGLAFARFAQPTARVLFSSTAVVAPYDGVSTLMFRTANQRGNQILEAEIRLYLAFRREAPR